jgi:hypothetical protein
MALVVDTGPLYAFIDVSDPDHLRCVPVLTTREQVVVPAPVVVELDWLLESRGIGHAFPLFLDDVDAGRFAVEELVALDYRRAGELCSEYSDFPLGFVDAAVLAVVERLGETKLATLDHRHFTAVRPRHTDALRLLPD